MFIQPYKALSNRNKAQCRTFVLLTLRSKLANHESAFKNYIKPAQNNKDTFSK